jgi:hypothetical protein
LGRPFTDAFGGQARGGTVSEWFKALRLNAQVVVKVRSIPHKSVRLSKDSALPFMLFSTLRCG